MLNTPFSPWPSFTAQEADAVRNVLLSNKVNYWTGTECRKFEKEFAAWAGTHHAVALGNGTLALDVALKALGIGPGDEVITSAYTYTASASPIYHVGAKIVLVDTTPESYEMDYEKVEKCITSRTKAIIPVDIAERSSGSSCAFSSVLLIRENLLHGT